jgi:dienelactone hydrolase
MKTVLRIIFLLLAINSFGQNKQPEDYGFRHLQTIYKGDTVDILIKSKKGEEQKAKPLLLFCQGSLPQPLMKFDEQDMFGVFPFNPDSLTIDYHIAIVSKPYIQLMGEKKLLGRNFTFIDSTGFYPKKYSERNLLDYYVSRNIEVIKFLQKQLWISKNRLVVAGHSEGSTVAAKLAYLFPRVTHLIYSGGNPMGRIMSIIEQSRAIETDTDSTMYGEENIKYWQSIVENKTDMNSSQGDTYRATYEFSNPPQDYLEQLNIPILVCYGTKDWSAPFNDYLRVDVIRKGKENFTFKAYIGTDHNYFPILPDGKPNFEIFNWDKVANDWQKWLKMN